MAAQDVLKFIDELATQAVTEAHAGDFTLLNRLGENPVMAYYIDNVHLRAIWTQEAWTQYRPGDYKVIEALYEDVIATDKAKLTESTVTDLSTKLEIMSKQLTEAVAEIQTLKAVQSGKKPAKPLKETETTDEPETPADDKATEADKEEATDTDETEVKADTEGK